MRIRDSKRRAYAKDPQRFKGRVRAWKARHPDYHRGHDLKRKYGLTVAQYNEMLVGQGSVCAICKSARDRRALVVDHDHATGRVRGLLCNRCNSGLGMLGDDAGRVAAAAAYLGRTT